MEAGAAVPVSVGRNGLAWGMGLHREVEQGPHKMEGDGKAPAGIFALGSAFGYDAGPPGGVTLSYKQTTENDYFIDDTDSEDYNRWVTLDGPTHDPSSLWSSFEHMRREDHLYELGVVILHNSDPIAKGHGSAIFFHIWHEPGVPTAGCTAMARSDLLELMRWLDPENRPLVIQATTDSLRDLRMK